MNLSYNPRTRITYICCNAEYSFKYVYERTDMYACNTDNGKMSVGLNKFICSTHYV